MKKLLIIYVIFITSQISTAQQYQDYIGSGHTIGVKVTTSNNFQSADGFNSINGTGLKPDLKAASRFLAHATLGADYETISNVAQMGFSNWLENQFNKDQFNFLKHLTDTLQVAAYNQHLADGGQPEEFGTSNFHRLIWWESIMKGDDLLRDRMALALGEIFVISEKSDLSNYTEGFMSFHESLYDNAFGNFRDLLFDVTMHPAMGFYLSHVNNPKADPATNRFPDENYAREVMQLFSIGLYELNNNGTRKKDTNGNFIPTYDNTDISEFAKIFTGLGGKDWSRKYYAHPNNSETEPYDFGINIHNTDLSQPMKMYEEWHQQGPKYLLNGKVVPAGQTGMQDINDAIDNLFYHPNVGPFIGRLLIQRLVKSNPSPEYINRVANAFNNNGSGIRGDMKTVIRAILMDSEARDCSWLEVAHHGMLKEPIVRYTQLLRAFNAYNDLGRFYNSAWIITSTQQTLEQHPMESPSVFNFFLPDYQPQGLIANAGRFAPEFQILNSSTSINYINLVQQLTIWTYVFDDYIKYFPNHENFADDRRTKVDYSTEIALITDPHNPTILSQDIDKLLERYDIILTHGNLKDNTKSIIKDALMELGTLWADSERIARFAAYFIMISPDYTVLK